MNGRARTTRGRAASAAQQDWNKGMSGGKAVARTVPLGRDCPTPNCGAVADSMDEASPTLIGWTRTGVYGSTEPDRVWCSGACAGYGVALAEVRVPAEKWEVAGA